MFNEIDFLHFDRGHGLAFESVVSVIMRKFPVGERELRFMKSVVNNLSRR